MIITNKFNMKVALFFSFLFSSAPFFFFNETKKEGLKEAYDLPAIMLVVMFVNENVLFTFHFTVAINFKSLHRSHTTNVRWRENTEYISIIYIDCNVN